MSVLHRDDALDAAAKHLGCRLNTEPVPHCANNRHRRRDQWPCPEAIDLATLLVEFKKRGEDKVLDGLLGYEAWVTVAMNKRKKEKKENDNASHRD